MSLILSYFLTFYLGIFFYSSSSFFDSSILFSKSLSFFSLPSIVFLSSLSVKVAKLIVANTIARSDFYLLKSPFLRSPDHLSDKNNVFSQQFCLSASYFMCGQALSYNKQRKKKRTVFLPILYLYSADLTALIFNK